MRKGLVHRMRGQGVRQKLKEITSSRVIQGAFCVALIGVLLLICGHYNEQFWQGKQEFRELTKDFGTTLVTTFLLSAFWELAGKRAFTEELLALFEVSMDVKEAGLQSVVWEFGQEIDWGDLFRKSSSADLFFAYARTWRISNTKAIEEFVGRDRIRLRVALADHEDARTVTDLSLRFDCPEEDMKNRIKESVDWYVDLKRRFPKAAIEVYQVSTTFTHTFYRFDNNAVLSLYNHTRVRGDIPTFVIDQVSPLMKNRSRLYRFIEKETDSLFSSDNPSVKKVL